MAATVASVSIVNAQEVSVSTTFAYESTYIFRGIEFAEGYYAPAVDVSFGDVYFGVWAAQPADAEYEGEVDFYGGIGIDISEGTSLDLGATLYTFDWTTEDPRWHPFLW